MGLGKAVTASPLGEDLLSRGGVQQAGLADRGIHRAYHGLGAGVDCIYHCDFADEEALDMLEAAKDRVIIGPAFGLVHNSVFEGDVVGMTREVVERMGLPRKLEHTVATYHQMRKRGMRVVVGGDYGFTVTPMGQNARDIGHFVKFFGYSPAEAPKCATAVGGDLMGHKGELGVIRDGALADIV